MSLLLGRTSPDLKYAKQLALKMRVMWKAINMQRTCNCEDCISTSVKPLRELAEDNDFWGFDEGRSKWVFMGKNYVIKVPRTFSMVEGVAHEARRMYRWVHLGDPVMSKYIVSTYPLKDGFVIQTAVDMISDENYEKHRHLIEALAVRYDICDLHPWNVGWHRGKIQLFDCPSQKMEQKMFDVYIEQHEEGRRKHAFT